MMLLETMLEATAKEEHLLRLLKQCTSLKTLKQIHGQMLATSASINSNLLLSKLVLDLHAFPYAALLFSRLPRPNDFSFNLMIRAAASAAADYPAALRLYLRMLRSGLKPNSFTFPFVLVAAANLPSLYHGRAAHSSALRLGLDRESNTRHSLVTMYARCGELGLARKAFDEILQRDLVSWNSMISGYAKMGFAKEAVALFERMGAQGFEPDEMTLVSVLAACGDLGDLSLGVQLERMIKENVLKMNSFVGSALVDMYGKCGELWSARRVFDGMPRRDLVVWNALITGYAQNGESDEAIKLFHAMREARIEPDKITMIGVLSACAAVGALDLGTQIDACASQKGLLDNVYVGTALIDMYAKCGSLDHAIKIFRSMPQKNIVAWNAMIAALAFHGQGREAILLFASMRDEEGTVCPNGVTFVGVLSACVHSGLVEEGRCLFDSMESAYGITPKIEHYSCMVDLLARAGRIEEAWEFIERMPEKPDATVLGALLCACRNCRNFEVGERVMKRILELEPLNSGNYVISSKIYASSKRWEDSARLRGLMRERGVSKTPGCSWIDFGNKVHEFRAGDGSHPRAVEIFWMIELLVDEMKIEGYTPRTDLL